MSAVCQPKLEPRLSTLILLSALCILPINIFLPSLTNMAEEFAVSYSTVSLSLAAYAAVAACLQIIIGPLSDRFGRRPIILWGLAVFQLATLGCIFAPDFRTFLICRMIQAAIAPTFAVALAVVRDTTDKEQAASKIGYIATAWSIAPMLGPSLGGLLDESFGWRASFWFLSLFAMAVFALCWFDLIETNHQRTRRIAEQFRAYPQLLRSKRFWCYALCLAFSVGSFYAFLAGAPLAAATSFNLSPASLGVFMGSITAGFMVGSFFAGRYASRVRFNTAIVAGRVLACAGLLLGLLLYALDVQAIAALFGPCMLVGLANGLTAPGNNSGAMSVRPDLAGSAAGLTSALTVLGGAIMSSITGFIVTEDNARPALLLVMLGSAITALGAALFAQHLEKTAQTTDD